MDISKLKELHSEITELKKRAEATDSKKETYNLNKERIKLENKFKILAYDILDKIPDDLDIRVTVNKVIPYDTTAFKSWIVNILLDKSDINDLDLIEELKTSIDEDFDPVYEIDNEDITITIEDDRLK